MTLLTPAALVALVLLPLIVLLHLRRRRYQPADVPSLIIWREVLFTSVSASESFAMAGLQVLAMLVAAAGVIFLGMRLVGPKPEPGLKGGVFLVCASLLGVAYGTFLIGKILEGRRFEVVYTSEKPIAPAPYPNTRSRQDWDEFLADLHLRWGGRWANPGRPE